MRSATNNSIANEIKKSCESTCGFACNQVNYIPVALPEDCHYQPVPGVPRFSFTLTRPQQETKIIYSAQFSFWALMSVILNGASFYFTFCPMTFFLSNYAMSFIVRGGPRSDNVEEAVVEANDSNNDPDRGVQLNTIPNSSTIIGISSCKPKLRFESSRGWAVGRAKKYDIKHLSHHSMPTVCET